MMFLCVVIIWELIFTSGKVFWGGDRVDERERFLNDLFDTEYEKLFTYCLKRLYDEQTAEDCVGEVFFRAYDSIDKLMDHPNPTGWLFKTAQLVLKEMIRKSNGRKRIIVLIDTFETFETVTPQDRDNSYSKIPERSIAEAKYRIISSLNERDRELYELIYVNKLAPSILSERTGRPIPTLRVQKSRLKEKLIKMVREYYGNQPK